MQELFVYFVLFERLSLAFGNKIAKACTGDLSSRSTWAPRPSSLFEAKSQLASPPLSPLGALR